MIYCCCFVVVVSEIFVSNVSFQFSVDNYILVHIMSTGWPISMFDDLIFFCFELSKFMTEHLRIDSLCVVRYMGDQK
jgi:hypothetical protein